MNTVGRYVHAFMQCPEIKKVIVSELEFKRLVFELKQMHRVTDPDAPTPIGIYESTLFIRGVEVEQEKK